MADSNADKIAQIKAFEEQQNALAAKQRDLRSKAYQAPEGPERDALLAQREQLRQESKDIDSRIKQVAPDNAATAVYEGPDSNSGQHTYVNPVTGRRFVAPDAPSDAQKANTIPFDANQSDKAQQQAVAADNKAAQQGYAGAPQPVADAPTSEKKSVPVTQDGVNTTVASGTDSGVTVGGPIANSAGPVTVTPLDKGADPYVSNGQSTIAPPSPQQTVSTGSDPSVSNTTTTAAAETPQKQKEVPVTTQTFDDGSKLETFADGATLTTDTEGNLSYSGAPPKANTATAQPSKSVAGSVDQVRTAQTVAVQRNSVDKADWRVRLSLAPGAKYLYNIAKPTEILYPLKNTDGVIFPYTPLVQTSYKATYDSLDLQHSNYKMHFYKNSSVEEIQVTADFTAQDTTEANYLLAVIHFFKSVTKMFYGQDGNNGPKAGTPPPLVYLNGYGTYQFNEHPCLVQSFTYNLPNDVDYVRAGNSTKNAGTASDSFATKDIGGGKGFNLMSMIRKAASNLKTQGKISQEPNWTNYANSEATYVPTKMQIQLSLLPVVTRNDISKNFSVELYGTGQLSRGNKRPTGGGIW